MREIARRALLLPALLCASLYGLATNIATAQTDPLPSWNDGAVKKSITDFVSRVTTPGSADFVSTE